MNVKSMIVGLVIAVVASTISPSHAADKMTRKHFPDLKISFAYTEKFKPVPPVESSTRFAVHWTTKSGGLMATCYLNANKHKDLNSPQDDVGARNGMRNNPHLYAKNIAGLSKAYGRKSTLISSKHIKINDLDGIYMVVEAESRSFDRTVLVKLYQLRTFWKNHEVGLFCGTTLPYLMKGKATDDQLKKVMKNVEAHFFRTFRTLHFERE
jgi:hypothetical protein